MMRYIHLRFTLHYITLQADRQDKQPSDSIGRTVLQTVTQKALTRGRTDHFSNIRVGAWASGEEEELYRGVGGGAGVDDESVVMRRQSRRGLGSDADAVRHGEQRQLFLLDAAARRPVVRHGAVHVAAQTAHLSAAAHGQHDYTIYHHTIRCDLLTRGQKLTASLQFSLFQRGRRAPYNFSERELMFTFAICCRPSVCRLSVCL